MQIDLILPDEGQKEHGDVLYVQQSNEWTITSRWTLCHDDPSTVGWFLVEDWVADNMERDDLRTLLSLDGISRVQRQRILHATEDFIERVLAAYMGRDDRIFNKAMGWVGAVTESDWDDVARQIEALRREWREEVKRDA